MGAILLIEDEREVQDLISRILPEEGFRVWKSAWPQGARGQAAEGRDPGERPPGNRAEFLREYLQEEIKTEKGGAIHESIMGKVEKTLIGMILEEEKGNQVRVAKRLGINRNTLRKKMKELQIVTRVITR